MHLDDLFHPYMVCGCWSYVTVAIVSMIKHVLLFELLFV